MSAANTKAALDVANIKLAQLHAVECAIAHLVGALAKPDYEVIVVDERLRALINRHEQAQAQYASALTQAVAS